MKYLLLAYKAELMYNHDRYVRWERVCFGQKRKGRDFFRVLEGKFSEEKENTKRAYRAHSGVCGYRADRKTGFGADQQGICEYGDRPERENNASDSAG